MPRLKTHKFGVAGGARAAMHFTANGFAGLVYCKDGGLHATEDGAWGAVLRRDNNDTPHGGIGYRQGWSTKKARRKVLKALFKLPKLN